MSALRPTRPSSSRSRAPARTLLLATDQPQSVIAECSTDRLNLLAYSPYGVQGGSFAARTRLGFNGQLQEPGGVYHLGNGHRVYNPVLMRFHSPDRLSPFDKGGVNAYAYCGADPINFHDPTGQFTAIARLVQLGETMALHVGILTATVVGPVAKGWQLVAARTSMVGSFTAIVGSGLQMGGVAAGAIVSNAGTALSVMGVGIRATVAISNHVQGGRLWQAVKDNVQNLARGTAFPKVRAPDLEMSGQLPAPSRRPSVSGHSSEGSAEAADRVPERASQIRGKP